MYLPLGMKQGSIYKYVYPKGPQGTLIHRSQENSSLATAVLL